VNFLPRWADAPYLNSPGSKNRLHAESRESPIPVGLAVGKRFPFSEVIPYIVAQVLGEIPWLCVEPSFVSLATTYRVEEGR
jgi:hypothetical protein